MEIKSKLTNGKEPALTVYGVGTLTHSFTMDITKARQLLGYEPLQTVDEAIDEFVEWYRTHEEH
jgi:nucleoside-diphosphate-sugar epimerase